MTTKAERQARDASMTKCVCGNVCRLGMTRCGRCEAAAEAVVTREQQIANVVDAIEAFVAAKISYESAYARDPQWASMTDVNETREHMRDKLAEVLT